MRAVRKIKVALTATEAISDVETHYEALRRARFVARAWSSSVDTHRRPDLAYLLVREALTTYATETRGGATLSEVSQNPKAKLDHSSLSLAKSIGIAAVGIPGPEALHLLTSLYAVLLPNPTRSKLGAFYTPLSLARRLLDLAQAGGIDWRTASVIDPASGGGVFLLEAAARIRGSLENCPPAVTLQQIANRIRGLEVDPYAGALAQNALEISLADLATHAGRAVPKMIRVCDSLEESPTDQFDLVVGNPPYGRVTLSAGQRERFSRSLYGHANLYGVFTDLAVRWAKAGGLIAYLTPASVLGGQYYAALRALLAADAPPISIDFVHARKGVFEDVLQETLLAVYRKGARPQRVQVHHLRIVNEREVSVTKNGTIALPETPVSPWMAPRDPAHSHLIGRAEKMPTRLFDWGYTVSTGPLVWNRFKPQLRDRPGRLVYPLIWAEAVTANGRFVYRAKKRNHAPYFKTEPGDEWLVVNEACVLVQRTTAKEQARRLIAAELTEAFIAEHCGVVVENHLNMIRSIHRPAVRPATVAAVFNSDVIDQVFRCISGSVAVSAFELSALPLPSVSEIQGVEALVDCRASRSEIEAELHRIYLGKEVG